MGRVVPHPRIDHPLRSSSVSHRGASLMNSQLSSQMEPELRRSSSAQSLPPVHVGATGSILSLLDRDVPDCLPGIPVVDAASVDVPSSSWLERPWMRSSRRRSSNGRDNTQKKVGANQTLETVVEAEIRVPKWKQFLRKLMWDTKSKSDGSKGSKTDGNYSAKGNGRHLPVEYVSEKQSKDLCKSLPPKSSEKPANLLWERRNIAPIAALDLTKLQAARAKRHTRRAVR